MLTFLTIQKKGDLSDNSKSDGAKNKKLREECSGSYEASPGDVFVEVLNDSSCLDILFNWLKELEAKVAYIYEVANTTKESQIKKTLRKHLMSTRKREKRKTNKLIEQQTDRQEQYSRRNCLLSHEERRHKITNGYRYWCIGYWPDSLDRCKNRK